jgi:hypothetical protein
LERSSEVVSPPASRQHFEIIGKEYPAFEGTTQPTIKTWIDKESATAENLSPPHSRQHFDVWSFATADKDATATRHRRPPARPSRPGYG